MKERPILFSTPMVQAILGGAKTQTRRVVKSELEINNHVPMYYHNSDFCPYGQIGDVLWVRETWNYVEDTSYDEHVSNGGYVYKADRSYEEDKWKPSIFMPREACRIRLKITDIRIEQLHYISEDDAKSEGSPMYVVGHGVIDNSELKADPGYSSFINYRMGFEHLWKSINGPESWNSNPFVWVINFEKIPSL